MSPSSPLFQSNGQFMLSNDEEKKHWDIAISCYEPLDLVTGGIGTYSRLLIDLLMGSEFKNKNVAIFCRKATIKHRSKKFDNVKFFEIPESWTIYGKPAERIGNEHDWYSWNLSHYLLNLAKQGHTFGFFEFPDYAVEAYFPLKMRRAGLLEIDTVAVRLHSPELMLFRDNLLPARSYDGNRLTRISRELFCYQHCDAVLYGAPAMLGRVSQECQRFGVEVEGKAVHVEHPYPMHDTTNTKSALLQRKSIHLGYIGRLEVRKGILRFLRTIADNEMLRKTVTDLDIVFELFGADCPDQNDISIRSQILGLHLVPELRGRIIVHGYMSQDDLKEKVKNLDGFVFPSLFENYPNALLEVLHSSVPILISEAGGMPYISRDLPGIYHFNYNSDLVRNVGQFLCSIRPVPSRRELYFAMATKVNSSIIDIYSNFAKRASSVVSAVVSHAPAGIDFVIPFYNDSQHITQCLKSIRAVMVGQDNLYVVDDVSRAEEFNALEKAIAQVFGEDDRVKIHRMLVNSGPSAARNVGVGLGENAAIQFLDADDHLNEMGFQVTKSYLKNNEDVDFVYGVQDNFGGKNHIWVPRDSSMMTCLDENYTHSAILIRRSTFEESGGFDDEMRLHFEDWQYNCKLALSGRRGEVVPFVTQHYRVRDGSRTFLNLEREEFSREQVIFRSCMNRCPTDSVLQGELLELIGKYSSMINGRWDQGDRHGAPDEPITMNMALADLCSLKGQEFVRAAYGVILGRHADEAGLKFYVDKLNQGITAPSIVADMMVSVEMRNKRRILPSEYYKGLRFKRIMRHPIIRKFVSRKSLSKG